MTAHQADEGNLAIEANGHELGRWISTHGVPKSEVDFYREMYSVLGDGTFLDVDCFYCGAARLRTRLFDDGTRETVQVVDPCPYPDGITIEFEVDFPSGRVVCDDDLRDVFGKLPDETSMESVNFAPGQRAWSLAEAARGVALGSVSDTSPDVRERDGGYVIESSAEDAPPPLATIYTDLWAYSLVDYERYLSCGGVPEGDPGWAWTRTVIEIPPGRYRFRHHACERGFDRHAEGAVFADFIRIA